MRARLALQVAQTACELREVILRDKPAAMLEASPKGTVPVLVLDDGSVIEESLDIMLWALEQSDPHAWLTPTYLDEALELITQVEDEFKPHLDRYKYSQRYEANDALEHRGAAARFLSSLEPRLTQSWLFGSKPSLADAAIAPFVRQFANTDRLWFDAQPWPALNAWLNDFLHAPLFEAVMHKYPLWAPGASPQAFPTCIDQVWVE